ISFVGTPVQPNINTRDQLDFVANEADLAFTGSLAGLYYYQSVGVATADVKLSYTADLSQYAAQGLITWPATGSIDGNASWSEAGSATFTGDPTNFIIHFRSNVTFGTKSAAYDQFVTGTTDGIGNYIFVSGTGSGGDGGVSPFPT